MAVSTDPSAQTLRTATAEESGYGNPQISRYPISPIFADAICPEVQDFYLLQNRYSTSPVSTRVRHATLEFDEMANGTRGQLAISRKRSRLNKLVPAISQTLRLDNSDQFDGYAWLACAWSGSRGER